MSAATRGRGQGGTLTITAFDSVEVSGFAQDTLSALTTSTTGAGSAGNLKIETSQLIIREQATVTSRSTGQGSAGNSGVESEGASRWKPGDLIVEPLGVYKLDSGRLVLSRECAR